MVVDQTSTEKRIRSKWYVVKAFEGVFKTKSEARRHLEMHDKDGKLHIVKGNERTVSRTKKQIININ